MIKSKKGKVVIKGTLADAIVDLHSIILCMNKTLGISEETFKLIVKKTYNDDDEKSTEKVAKAVKKDMDNFAKIQEFKNGGNKKC